MAGIVPGKQSGDSSIPFDSSFGFRATGDADMFSAKCALSDFIKPAHSTI